jgi:hypothetical protein
MKKNLSVIKLVEYMCSHDAANDCDNNEFMDKIFDLVSEAVYEIRDAYDQGVEDCKNGIVDGPPPNAEKYIVETYNPSFKD